MSAQGRHVLEVTADSNASQLTFRCEVLSGPAMTASCAISGRLRAAIVLGLRLHLDAALREAVAGRILARLDGRR